MLGLVIRKTHNTKPATRNLYTCTLTLTPCKPVKPEICNPEPATPVTTSNPKPVTCNSYPATRNPQHETCNPEPGTRNLQHFPGVCLNVQSRHIKERNV